MGKDQRRRRITVRRPERTRPRGRPKRRWQVRTRADVKKMRVQNMREIGASREKFDEIMRQSKRYINLNLMKLKRFHINYWNDLRRKQNPKSCRELRFSLWKMRPRQGEDESSQTISYRWYLSTFQLSFDTYQCQEFCCLYI